MCLNSVTEVLKASQKRVVKAYKYFDLYSDKADSVQLRLPYRYFNQNDFFFERNLVRQDVWLKAKHVELQTDNRMQVYTSGFHAFSEKVKLWEVYTVQPAVLIEVYLYGIRVKGTEHDRPCVVADWLYVPSDSEAAAPAAPTSERKPRAHTATTAKAKQPKL
jgi:hypothetical protein